MDASQKYAEQLRHAREITKNLEDLVTTLVWTWKILL
jgi:hypothetical protein